MSNQTRKMAEVELIGDEYKIVSIITENIAEKDKKYFKLSSPLANDILVNMDRGMTAYFPKNIRKLRQDILSYKESTDLDVRKNNAVSYYMRMMSSLFVSTSFMDFFDFITMNNTFCSKGIFITDENREEEYLKIINTGDSKLIESLESYLESFDTLTNVNKRYMKIKNVIHRINDCQSIEELEQLLSENHQL